jgi:hypothetical protein
MRVGLHRDSVPQGALSGSFMARLGKRGQSKDPDSFKEVMDLLEKLSSRGDMWTWAYVLDEKGVYALLYRTRSGGVTLGALRAGEKRPLQLPTRHGGEAAAEVRTVKLGQKKAALQLPEVKAQFETLPNVGDVLVDFSNSGQSVLKAWIRIMAGNNGHRVLSRGSGVSSRLHTYAPVFY